MTTTKTRMMPEEAGRYIGCGYDKIMQMVRRHEIPCYRVGRRVFFRKESLDLWIESLERLSLQEAGNRD